MPKGYKLLVFDWDGTLVDSIARIVSAFHRVIEELGLAPRASSDIEEIIGLGLPEAFASLYPGAETTAYERFCASYRRHFFSPHGPPAVLFDGALETVQGLHRAGYVLAVATGKGRRGLNLALEETGCRPWFHATRCAEEAFSKPHPQMLFELMEEFGVLPDETLMIGDSAYDLEMARNAGTAAVAVTTGVHARGRLMRLGPSACLDSIAELSEWLAGIGAGESPPAVRRRGGGPS